MKKTIITLAIIFVLAPIAQAETVNVFDGGSDDTKVIFTTSDEGETRSSMAYRATDSSWVVFDDRGNSSIVNDFSGGNDRDPE